MKLRHIEATDTFGIDEVVTIFVMSASGKMTIEGRATIIRRADDAGRYKVRFQSGIDGYDNVDDHPIWDRFIDPWGQENPEAYCREFNKRIGK